MKIKNNYLKYTDLIKFNKTKKNKSKNILLEMYLKRKKRKINLDKSSLI